jgi:hypothetical protein
MSSTEQDFETLAAWIREKPERLERVRAFLDAATTIDAGPKDIEDLQADTWPLVQILDQLAFLLQGIPRKEDDREQHQADALAWCALRMAQKIDRDIDTLVHAEIARRRAETAKDREGQA